MKTKELSVGEKQERKLRKWFREIRAIAEQLGRTKVSIIMLFNIFRCKSLTLISYLFLDLKSKSLWSLAQTNYLALLF